MRNNYCKINIKNCKTNMIWPEEEQSSQKRPIDVPALYDMRPWHTYKLRRSQLMTCVCFGDDTRLSTRSACINLAWAIVDTLQYDIGPSLTLASVAVGRDELKVTEMTSSSRDPV